MKEKNNSLENSLGGSVIPAIPEAGEKLSEKTVNFSRMLFALLMMVVMGGCGLSPEKKKACHTILENERGFELEDLKVLFGEEKAEGVNADDIAKACGVPKEEVLGALNGIVGGPNEQVPAAVRRVSCNSLIAEGGSCNPTSYPPFKTHEDVMRYLEECDHAARVYVGSNYKDSCEVFIRKRR